MTIKLIATAFSTGKFEEVYSHIAENTVWTIVEDSVFEGKNAIVEQCAKVADYFNSISTRFTLQDIIQENRKVVVTGTAAFLQNNQSVSIVYACDVYEFDENNQILTITSYCIAKK